MGDIGSVISKTVQLLIILIIGIYARKKDFINRQTVTYLSKLLSHVTSPLLIFCSFQREYDPALLGSLSYRRLSCDPSVLLRCSVFLLQAKKGFVRERCLRI